MPHRQEGKEGRLPVTLPFTRMLAGPMDYTPGGFDNVTKESFEARDIEPSVMGEAALAAMKSRRRMRSMGGGCEACD